MRNHLVSKIAVACVMLPFIGMVAAPVAVQAGDLSATIIGCVYNKNTGKPILGATVFVQSLGSANGGGTQTGVDGCTTPMTFNTELFPGDYIQASVQSHGRTYLEQYRIPNALVQQTYHYDFFLDVPRMVRTN